MPPTGGFGGNTGVADAHNLAWKLALVTKGLAGPGLLTSYDVERRPISALTAEQAYTRYVLRVDPSLPQRDLQQPMDDASIELGAIYRSAAVLAEDTPDRPLDDPRSRSWLPGTRVPHLDHADHRSTHDHPGHRLALLVDGAEDDWRKVAGAAQARLDVPITVQAVQDENLQGAALVRPDGVIAWRTREDPATAGLDRVLGGLLDRSGAD
jgi:hypothetical protein